MMLVPNKHGALFSSSTFTGKSLMKAVVVTIFCLVSSSLLILNREQNSISAPTKYFTKYLMDRDSEPLYPVKVNPLPAPRNITWGSSGPILVEMVPQLQTNFPCPEISQAYQRAFDTIRNLKWYPAALEKKPQDYASDKGFANTSVCIVSINVEDFSTSLQLGVNETYTLELVEDSNTISINAATIWGALHALTTLQQLIVFEKDNFFIEEPVSIWDSPIFTHRGILIDSGRNFISVPKIKEQIEIMALSKMNSLHWHIYDTQSWPIEMVSLPEMINDAYSLRERYHQSEVIDIVEYGKLHGVRIIPEMDLPGHSAAGWKEVDPEIVICNNDVWTDVAVEPGPGQLDPLNNKTYEVVQKVYDELSRLFQDNVFHVGLDELNSKCYQKSKSISEFVAENSWDDLVQYWIDRALPIFNNSETRRLTMWEDAVLGSIRANNLSTDVILQSWNSPSNIKNLTAKGYQVIVSSNMLLYLDCGYGGFLTNDPRYIEKPANDEFNNGNGGSYCNPYKTWQRIYDFNIAENLTEQETKLVLGAEVAIWGEQADTTVLTQKLWPRAAALGESMWSGNRDFQGNYRTTYFTQRINNFREYLVALQHDASPLMPKYCVQNPHACDLYEDQNALNNG